MRSGHAAKILLRSLAFLFLAAGLGLLVSRSIDRHLVLETVASTDARRWEAVWKSGDELPPLRAAVDLLPTSIPGPRDLWAGARAHGLTLLIDVAEGTYVLRLECFDVDATAPPLLAFELDGREVSRVRLKAGYGSPPPYEGIVPALTMKVPLPPVAAGEHRLKITNVEGSWVAPASVSVLGGYRLNAAQAGYALLTGRKFGPAVAGALLVSVFCFAAASAGVAAALANTALALVSLAVALLLGEVAFRSYLLLRPGERVVRTAGVFSKSKPAARHFTAVTMSEPQPDPDTPYTLHRNIDGMFCGHPLRTNSHGMRGPEVSVEKPAGVLRVIGLGDSLMFGWCVAHEDTMLAKIGAGLAAELGREVETLNMGVPSYNTAVEVAGYRKWGRAFRPDLAVLLFVENDFGFPSKMLEPVRLFATDVSYVRQQLRRSLVPHVRVAQDEREELVTRANWNALETMEERQRAEQRAWLSKVTRYYERMVGKEKVAGYLRDWAAMLREDGVVGVVVYHPTALVLDQPSSRETIPGSTERIDAFLAQATATAGLEYVDMTPVYEDYLRGQGFASEKEAFWVKDGDSHPRPIGHQLMAEAVVRLVREKKLLGGRAAPPAAAR